MCACEQMIGAPGGGDDDNADDGASSFLLNFFYFFRDGHETIFLCQKMLLRML